MILLIQSKQASPRKLSFRKYVYNNYQARIHYTSIGIILKEMHIEFIIVNYYGKHIKNNQLPNALNTASNHFNSLISYSIRSVQLQSLKFEF
jgi:hypothetical protein